MKPKRNPSRCRIGTRRCQSQILTQTECQIYSLHGTFNSCTAHLAIALHGMAITNREERTLNRNWQVQRAPRNQFFAVHVPSTETWRSCSMHTRFVRRHSHYTHKWAQSKCMTVLIPS